MKKTILAAMIMSVSVSISSAELPWKEKAPDMSKAPPSELDKAIQKLPLAQKPKAKKKVVKEKPGAEIGMSRQEVYFQTNWGRPESAKKIINADGEWIFWYYNGGTSILTFLDDELYEIEQSEDCQ